VNAIYFSINGGISYKFPQIEPLLSKKLASYPELVQKIIRDRRLSEAVDHGSFQSVQSGYCLLHVTR
jgi:hypothetical protein